MTRPKQKRDNAYYLARLRKEHPTVHADYQAGKFKNLTGALVKAGLRKRRTGLDMLKSAWKNASASERDAFKSFIGCATPAVTGTPVSSSGHVAPSSPATSSAHSQPHHLPADLEVRIRDAMNRRGLNNGDVMREIGRKPTDTSLGMALSRKTRLQADMIEDLRAWVTQNSTP
jgi:hypothetical protein